MFACVAQKPRPQPTLIKTCQIRFSKFSINRASIKGQLKFCFRSINQRLAIENHLFDQLSINQMDIEILNNYLLLGLGLFKLDFNTHYRRQNITKS